jgi:hypothetical protein
MFKSGEGSYVSQEGKISVIKCSKHALRDDKSNVNKSQFSKHVLCHRQEHRRIQ